MILDFQIYAGHMKKVMLLSGLNRIYYQVLPPAVCVNTR